MGNDLLYGIDPPQILVWVEDCLRKLAQAKAELTLVTLPLESLNRVGSFRYRCFQTALCAGKNRSWEEMKACARELDQGLRALAEQIAARLIVPEIRWFGFDPIHILPRFRNEAWQRYLFSESSRPAVQNVSLSENVAAWRLRPSQRRFWGRLQVTRQPILKSSQGIVWMF